MAYGNIIVESTLDQLRHKKVRSRNEFVLRVEKLTVWACFHRKMAQEHSYRVRDKQVMNEDSVVFPECRAVTLHGEHLDPQKDYHRLFVISESFGLLHDVHAERFEE